MAKHKVASLVIIAVFLFVGILVLGFDGMKRFFMPTNIISLDTNPQSIVIPSAGTLSAYRNTFFPTVAPSAETQMKTIRQDSTLTVRFDENCQVNPMTLVVPVGSTIRIKNQSINPRTVMIGSSMYSLRASSSSTMNADAVGTYSIRCEDRSNVGKIIVVQ